MQARVIVNFGPRVCLRLGLWMNEPLEVYDGENRTDGGLWVKCPPVEIKRGGETFHESPGWVLLEAGEWEYVN